MKYYTVRLAIGNVWFGVVFCTSKGYGATREAPNDGLFYFTISSVGRAFAFLSKLSRVQFPYCVFNTDDKAKDLTRVKRKSLNSLQLRLNKES